MLTYPTTLYVVIAHCPSAKHLPLDAHWVLLNAPPFFLFWLPRMNPSTPRTTPDTHCTVQHHFKIGSAPWSPATQLKSGSHWAQVSLKPAEPKRHSQVGGGRGKKIPLVNCPLHDDQEAQRLAMVTTQFLFGVLLVRGGSNRGCWDLVLSCDLDPTHSHAEPTCQCRRQKRDRVSPWVGKIP